MHIQRTNLRAAVFSSIASKYPKPAALLLSPRNIKSDMTEILQRSFVDRDLNEFKLLKPHLRRGGDEATSGKNRGVVPVARLTNGTPIKSGRAFRKLHKIERTLRLVVLAVLPRNHHVDGQSTNKKGRTRIALSLSLSPIGRFCDDSNHLMIPVRIEFLWRIRDRPTDGRRDATNTRRRRILMTRWNPVDD